MNLFRRDFLKGLAAALIAPVPVIRPNLSPVPQEQARPQAKPQATQEHALTVPKAGEAIRKGDFVYYDYHTRRVFPYHHEHVRPYIGVAIDSYCPGEHVNVLVIPRPLPPVRIIPRAVVVPLR